MYSQNGGIMKKSLAFLFALLFFGSLILAKEFSVGASVGYYSIADSTFKQTYGSGSLIYCGFFSYVVGHNIELRGEISYFHDRGEMTLTKETIEFSMIPVVLGARYKIVDIYHLSPYIGAGFDFYSFKESARIGDTSDSTVGFHIEGGCAVALGESFFFDLSLRYIKADAEPYDEIIRLGGFKVAVGVGYSF